MATIPSNGIQRAGFESMFPGQNAVFMPVPGENYEGWKARITAQAQKMGWPLDRGMMFQYTSPQFFDRIKGLAGWDDSGQLGQQHGGQAAGPATGSPMNRNQAIDDFYRMMMDPNAPELRAAQEHGTNLAQRGAAGRGIRGGLSDAGIRKAGLDSRMGLASQRADLGLRAIQGGMNYDLGMGTQAIQKQGMQFDQNQSNDINAYNREKDKWQMIASAGGQVAGGLIEASKSYGTNSAGGVPNNVGGAGSYNTYSGYTGSDPSEYKNPFGGY